MVEEAGPPGERSEHPDEVALQAFLEGEVEGEGGEALRRHMGGCPACRAAADSYASLLRRLSDLPREPHPLLPARVMERIASGEAARRVRRARVMVPATVAAALAFLGWIFAARPEAMSGGASAAGLALGDLAAVATRLLGLARALVDGTLGLLSPLASLCYRLLQQLPGGLQAAAAVALFVYLLLLLGVRSYGRRFLSPPTA